MINTKPLKHLKMLHRAPNGNASSSLLTANQQNAPRPCSLLQNLHLPCKGKTHIRGLALRGHILNLK
ncbi:transcription factor tfiiib component [Histoplasma capsulatum G186AR]|uniref:Transcription factor tfiiib component n=1 Tax=Ajellomyces capsulatus TaxID=5037 RepID=A0A8H7YU29_AJECA|nr:transcription factor tfiiib component [Histoplasma capsulatum]QSS74138.1 transcription factor tfiiib component [Histoplasma capsulatum G186AR]